MVKKFMLGAKQHGLIFVCLIITCCSLANVARAIDFKSISQVIFFGDSLTDGGFNDLWPTEGVPGQPLPPGKAPTFTTYGGYIWSQYVAHDIKGFALPVYPGPSVPDTITNNSIYPVAQFVSGTLTGVNYAAAGSTTNSTGFVEVWAPSLHQQVGQYLGTLPPGQNADPNAVYFIWSGANDFLSLLTQPTLPTELQLLLTAQTAAINIANEVALLSSRGAKRFVIISLPNLGLAPFASLLGDPTIPGTLKTISFTFNSMLNTQLGIVIAEFGVKILYVDVYTLLEDVINAIKAHMPYVISGHSFLFTNYTDPACSTVPSAIYCPSGTPSGYVFADTLHPSDMAHQVIALEVEKEIHSWV